MKNHGRQKEKKVNKATRFCSRQGAESRTLARGRLNTERDQNREATVKTLWWRSRINTGAYNGQIPSD